jgi:ribosomal protein S18 acetylase RimI-like enzyme
MNKPIALLIWIFVSINMIQVVQPFTPPSMGLGAIFFRPKNIIVSPNKGDDTELVEAAKFFTGSFWAGKVGGAKELSPRQLKSLSNSQIAEFRKRYGGSFMTTRNKPQDRRAELIVCKNSMTEDIYGCAGIEVSEIKTPNGRSAQFKAPLMSNLAVGRNVRRKGIAEDLVQATEDLALKEWGYTECYLFVEKMNKPALKLYQKLGYKIQWEDDTATTLLPTVKGTVVSAPTIILCMKKRLGGGIFGNLFG